MLSSATVRDVLRRMKKPDTTRITEQVAREIAAREGIKALLAGEVAHLGGRRILIDCRGAPERVTVASASLHRSAPNPALALQPARRLRL